MTTPHPSLPTPSLNDDTLFAEADAWFFRLRAEDATQEDQTAFHHWLNASPAHARAWAEVESLFDATAIPAREVHAKRKPATSWPTLSRLGRLWFYAGAVACAALAVLPVVWNSLQPDTWLADEVSDVGERRVLSLDDGTDIEMDTDTALDTDMAGPERRIRLRHGQAFFDVAHDPSRPFVISTRHGEVRVVGTRFSVNEATPGTAVAVEDGIVTVTTQSGMASRQRLIHDQRSTTDGTHVSRPAPFDADVEFAWRRGQIVFRQQPLSDLVAQLDRYWPGKMVVMDGDLARREVSGIFEVDRREDCLNALHALLGVRTMQITPYLTLLY